MRSSAGIMLFFCIGSTHADEPDHYERYVKKSKDFQRVKQDKDWLYKAYPSWVYMPWTYQWTIGYTDESGKWSRDHGYNGSFVDWDWVEANGSKTGKLDWINKFQLRFYVDHLAGKRELHLWDKGIPKDMLDKVHGDGVRIPPIDDAMRDRLRVLIKKHVSAVKSSPMRAAYALDDEVSWGHFVHPAMWRVTGDMKAYQHWLDEIYGSQSPKRKDWITYEAIRPKVSEWSLKEFDASPLMDQWTFNDSYWNNFLGDLVEYANELDPHTPCGIVGCQCPNAFGGYDYAKLMRKIQFIETYNIGGSQSLARSFSPRNAVPMVTTHGHKSTPDTIWQTWYFLAHGNRGFIGWVEGWFDGAKPKPWHDDIAPTFLEVGSKIGPLVAGAEWKHDGVAIYYSHPSIQLGWILDAQAHRQTWINRNNDFRLGSSHQVRKAWENMLRDSGIQYDFLAYPDVITRGIPSEYKVLILPACLCLSDAEISRIKAFVEAGGTLIADYMPGLWDQHGKGRANGKLDELFGAHHDSNMKMSDVFGGNLWCEIDQDVNYEWKTYDEFLTNGNKCVKHKSGFHKAVRKMDVNLMKNVGKGKAVLLNLSPQWYNAYRVAGFESAKKRKTFLDLIEDAIGKRWVRIKDAGEKEHGYEITYWNKDGRTILFLFMNPEFLESSTGGGSSTSLKTDVRPITLEFIHKMTKVRDERAGKNLGDGKEFPFDWRMNEAIVVSFESR